MRPIATSLTVLMLAFTSLGNAAPVVTAGYDIQLYASGMGAISGMQIGPDGKVYAVDNGGGRVFRVETNGTVTQVASGIPYPNGIAFTTSGRMFVASGGGQAVYEVANGTATVFANMGAGAYPTSVAALGNALYVSNSGNGTISRVQMDGSAQVVLSGFSSPSGPMGLSFDKAGRLYFMDHGTGGVYSYDFRRQPKLLTTVTSSAGTFTGTGFKSRLFFTDVNLGYLLWLGDSGTTVFASGFAAKSSPPYIGPNGITYDGRNKLYVGDAGSIYVITRVK
jgi:sugar lactone lactonase YvrE